MKTSMADLALVGEDLFGRVRQIADGMQPGGWSDQQQYVRDAICILFAMARNRTMGFVDVVSDPAATNDRPLKDIDVALEAKLAEVRSSDDEPDVVLPGRYRERLRRAVWSTPMRNPPEGMSDETLLELVTGDLVLANERLERCDKTIEDLQGQLKSNSEAFVITKRLDIDHVATLRAAPLDEARDMLERSRALADGHDYPQWSADAVVEVLGPLLDEHEAPRRAHRGTRRAAEAGEVVRLPRHISLSISHQPHARLYQTIEDYLRDGGIDAEDLLPTDREQVLASGDLWEAVWYPNSPVGHCAVYAATIERLLERLNS